MRQNVISNLISSAKKYLLQDENRLIKITLADVVNPITMCRIDGHGDLVYGTSSTGDDVQFYIDDVRMVAHVPLDPVSLEDRDGIAMQEAFLMSKEVSFGRFFEREYRFLMESEKFQELLQAKKADGDENLEQTFARVNINEKMIHMWEPFIERKYWLRRVHGFFGIPDCPRSQ